MSEGFLPHRLRTEEGTKAVIHAHELRSWRQEFSRSDKKVDLTASARAVAGITVETLREEFGSLTEAIKKSSSLREELVAFESVGPGEDAV